MKVKNVTNSRTSKRFIVINLNALKLSRKYIECVRLKLKIEINNLR